MKQLYANAHFPNGRNYLLALAVLVFLAAQVNAQQSDKTYIPTSVQSFLPGTLVNWSAKIEKNKVFLTWTTTVEKNTLHFTVEKSFDGESYSEAAVLFAAGNSDIKKSYVFTEKVSHNGNKLIYYRLKMVDLDRNVKYSDVRTVKDNQLNPLAVALFPNPAVNDLKITISGAWVNEKVVVEIFDLHGFLVKTKINEKALETETLPVRDLKAGLYIVKVTKGSESSTQRFLKN